MECDTEQPPVLGAAWGASEALPADLLLLNAEQVAKVIGMGRTKVYELMAAGQLPVVRIGIAVRVNRRRLLEWIEEHTEQR